MAILLYNRSDSRIALLLITKLPKFVCVCVRLFLPETEDTNQRIKIKSRTTPQPWTVLDSPRLEKMVQTNAIACGYTCKKKKKK